MKEDKPHLSMPPTTTAAEDITVAGQRRINLIWEVTQAAIAILVTVALIVASITKVASPELNNAFFLIVGFYFSRTNHTQIGGIGTKAYEGDQYKGR